MSAIADWLEQQLQRRGVPGQELPYDADVKWTVRQHLLDLVAAFPTLVLKVQNYTHTDGTVVPLFVAEGTLPMFYQGVKYNIPVSVWLPERYPRQPPIMYVVPTHDMMIKPRHTFVTPSGVVNSPYVRNWRFPSSNLEVMAHDTSMCFGQEPPLFQKPPNFSAPPPTASPLRSSQTQPDTFQNPITSRPSDPYAGSYNTDTSSGMDWRPNVSPVAQPGPHRVHTPPPPPEPPKPPPPPLEDIFRETAIKALSGRLTSAITAVHEEAARDTDRLFEEQAELGRRKQELDRGVAAVQAERGALETCVLELSGKAVALERWLADNESKNPLGEVDADVAIVPADVLSKQALEAQAEDLALEDTLYSLDKALQEGVLTSETYMRQVRLICRKQFWVRALGTKVANRQHELRRSAAAAPIAYQSQQQHVQMPQGDSWSNTGILANPLAGRH